MSGSNIYDAVIVGGGPSGATAAADLAGYGRRVLLLDRAGRIKPCGGAIPPRLVKDFAIPEHLLVAKARGARIIAPSEKQADMPIDSTGYVAMVDREHFDEWLRDRAEQAGAERVTGLYDRITHDEDGVAVVHFALKDGAGEQRVRTRVVIGADGARSVVAKHHVKGADRVPYVFAYHEIVPHAAG